MGKSSTGKRYSELEDVLIDATRIPESFRSALGFISDWAIIGDNAVDKAIRGTPKQKLLECVDAIIPLEDQIHDFAFESPGAKLTPIPQEVVLCQIFLTAYANLKVEAHVVRLKDQQKNQK